jgi:two-component system response regulator GlrR
VNQGGGSGWGENILKARNDVLRFFMKTILLIDDDHDILNLVGEILTGLGYKVLPQPDAESALSILRQGTRVDLVITDLQMPGMSGMELVPVLRRVLPSVPVIMFTAHGEVETYLKSLSLGVFEYINKPIEENELGRIVKAALEWSETDNFSPAS